MPREVGYVGLIMIIVQGNLSVPTTRLLKALLSGSCIWSSLRKTEGLGYDATLEALEGLYPADPDKMDDDKSSAIPEAIRSLINERVPMEALGSMIWWATCGEHAD